MPTAFDLDFASIARFHPDRLRFARVTDTGRRAGENDIAGLQRHAFGEIDERLGKRKHHVVGVVGLHGLAVEPARDLQTFAARRNFVGRDHPGAEAAGAVEILAHAPLRRVALEFAHRALIGAGIAGNAVDRVIHA